MVIQTLAQEVSTDFSSDLEAARRKEIVDAILFQADTIFPFLYSMFNTFYQQYTMSAPNSEPRVLAEKIISELLQTSLALLGWMTPDLFFNHNFASIWCHLLAEENFKNASADNLLLFVTQKWCDITTKLKAKEVLNDFVLVLCNQCSKVIGKVDPNTILDDYDFHKKLAKIISGYGTTNLYLLKKTDELVYEKFFDMLIEFSKYPSQVIFLDLCEVWHTALEHKTGKKENMNVKFTTNPKFEKYYGPLLEACSNKMIREVGNPENESMSSSLMNQTASLEFQDKQEYTEFFSSARSKLATIVRLITWKAQIYVLQYSGRGLEEVIKRNTAAKTDILTADGFCDMTSQTYVLWEAATTMLEWAISSIHWKDLRPSAEHFKILDIMFNMLTSFQTKDPNIQTRYLHCFQILSPYFTYNHKNLDATLQALYTHMQFRIEKEANRPVSNLSEDTQGTRRKAFSVFIHLCNAHSGYLLNFLNSFVDNSEKLWKENKIASAEIVMLYEAFVVISNQWKNYDKQFQFLCYLLNSSKEEWKSRPFSEVVSSEELLLKGLGIIEEPDENKRNALKEVRERIIHNLTMFRSIAKRMPKKPADMGLTHKVKNSTGKTVVAIRYPIAPFLIEILPNVMSLIRTLHSISREEIQKHIAPDRRHLVFNVSIEDQHTMMGKTFNASALSEHEYYLYLVSKNVQRLRASTYDILGHACHYCDTSFWSNEHLYSLLSNSVFAFLDQVTNKDLRLLLDHFVMRFVTNCPKERYNTLLAPILMALYTLIYNRLDSGWNQLIAITKGNFNGATSVTEEVIQEYYLRALTKEVMDIPLEITKCMSPGSKNKGFQEEPLCKFLLVSEPIIATMLMIATRIITLPDSSAVQKAVMFAHRVIPSMSTSPKLQMIVGGELLQTAVTGLMVAKQESFSIFTSLIADIYYRYSPLCNYPEQILSLLPTATQIKITNLNKALKDKQMTEKKFISTMRNFLKDIGGCRAGDVANTRRTILKIGPVKQRGNDTNSSFLDSITLDYVADLFK
jgi:exportin-5